MRAISLFSGAGGLDLGFEAAGYQVAIAVEMDPDSVSTLRHNRDWTIIERDIHSVSSSELLKLARLRVGEADVLIGGPPCQPFSKSGFWATGDTLRLDDPRAGTLEAYLRVLRDALPRAFLLENVEGIAFRGKSDGLDLFRATLEKINRERKVAYTFSIKKLNTAEYGVPQLRERVFIVGSREGRDFRFPKPTNGCYAQGDLFEDLTPFRTAWDAIGDLEDTDDPNLVVRGKWADLLPSIPEGQNYLWHTDRGGGKPFFGWRRRYWSFLLKLAKDKPSWTIQAQPGPATGPFHWKNRRLSVLEMCRLQTFPEGFKIIGGMRSCQRQLGNAVPAALAEVLGRAIRRDLLGHTGVTISSKLIPCPRIPVPDPEPVARIPKRFIELEGWHEAHPGTGQGYSALARST